MLSNDTKVKQVKALSRAELRHHKIRDTKVNRALTEVMLEVADKDLMVNISEAELSMLTGVYLDLKEAAPVVGLRELITQDAGVRAFWAGVKNVTQAPEKQRAEAWISAYNTWEKSAAENQWWRTPWGHRLLTFVQRERFMIYGYKLMPKPPRYAQ